MCLGLKAEIACLHILTNVARHLQPPIVAGYQFQGLPPTCMTGYSGVVVLRHDPASELQTSQNVDLPSEVE